MTMLKSAAVMLACMHALVGCASEDEQATEGSDALSLQSPGPLMIIRRGNEMCLDVDDDHQYSNGTQLQVWTCNGKNQQKFKWDGEQIRTYAGKCLDVHLPDITKNGGRVQIWECNGEPQQRWTVVGNTIRSNTGKCLDVVGADRNKDGGKVQVWECNTAPQQEWRILTE